MLCVLSVCKNDAPQALKLAKWIRELGGVAPFEIILAISKNAYMDKLHEPIETELRMAFRAVTVYVTSDIEPSTWPRGANHGFIRVCKDVIQNNPQKPFLWLEPDAIPLKQTWLAQIEHDYILSKKPFMGAFVDLPNTKQHMSGIGVYVCVDSLAPNYVLSHEYAFDVVMADQVLPKAYFTNLICHQWKPEPFKNKEDLQRIPPEAVLYHQDKTGGIIDLLRGGCGLVEKPTDGKSSEPAVHAMPAPQSLTEKQLIEALATIAKKTNLDRGRIIKQLRIHKLSK